MIARVVVVPHPPLLVPELVGGHDADVQVVRDACLAMAGRLADASHTWLAIGADDQATGRWPLLLGPDAVGTFRGFGVDVTVGLAAWASGRPDPAMALPALVAGWLRDRVGADQVQVCLVPPDLPSAQCQHVGERLIAESVPDEPIGLLVLGDGSHRHGERSVGRADHRAAGFDDQVRLALASADHGALLALGDEVAGALGAAGRAAWQVLAGLIGKEGRPWRCVESCLLVPFGVAYHLAVWDPVI